MRSGCARCRVSNASLPAVTSRGEGKYVGDVSPNVPRIEATCAVMPILSPAVRRARAVLFEPRATFKEVDSEFTKPGAIWGRYVLPLAAIGPLAGAVGRLVFGKRIAGTS